MFLPAKRCQFIIYLKSHLFPSLSGALTAATIIMQTAGKSVVVAVVVLSVFTVTTTAHMMSLGGCRSFEGMENFEPARVRQPSSCVHYAKSKHLIILHNTFVDISNFGS